MATEAGVEARRVAGALTSMRIDELISHLAIGMALGQTELDKASMEIAQFMSEARVPFGKKPGRDVPDELSLIELGFTPNFYQFVDTILEIRVAVSSQYEQTQEYGRESTSAHITEQGSQSEDERKSRDASSGATRSRDYNIGWGRIGRTDRISRRYRSNAVDQSSSSSYMDKSVNVTTVDAKYSSTYNYSVEGSSMIKTKVVPIPAPAVYEERVRALVQQMKEREEFLTALYEIKATLPEVIGKAQEIGGKVAFEGELTTDAHAIFTTLSAAGAFNRTKLEYKVAESIASELKKLREPYDSLTVDHWAIVGSVETRSSADSMIGNMISSSEAILGSFESDNPTDKPSAEVTDETLQGHVLAIKEGLKGFRDALKKILTELPKTPEEEAEQEALAGGGG